MSIMRYSQFAGKLQNAPLKNHIPVNQRSGFSSKIWIFNVKLIFERRWTSLLEANTIHCVCSKTSGDVHVAKEKL